MEKILRPVWAEIDLDALAYNMKNIKALAKDKEVIAVVKADCYGHGSVDTAPVLLENGASRLAVAVLTEGIELRNAGITAPIMILGYTPEYLGKELIEYDIEQTVYSLEYAHNLSETALSLNKKAKIHIALDTGMGRIGFMPNEKSLKEAAEKCSLPGLEVIGMFTHFSTADEENKDYTRKQFSKYMKFAEGLSNLNINIPLKHVSNSGAIIFIPVTFIDLVSVISCIIIFFY